MKSEQQPDLDSLLSEGKTRELCSAALSGVVEPEEVEQLIKSATRPGWSDVSTWLIGLAIAAITVGGMFFIMNTIYNRIIRELSLYGLFGIALSACYLMMKRKTQLSSQKLSKLLVKKYIRPKFCLICRYELRGVASTRCPECGEPLAPPPEDA